MKDLEKLSLEKKQYYSAIIWGIVIMIHSFIVTRYLDSRLDRFYIIRNIDSMNTTVLWMMYWSIWIVKLITFYWTVKIAKEQNREPLFWGIFGLISPSLALIIIGFLDYKYDNKYLKKLENRVRLDYLSERAFLNNKIDADFDKLESMKSNLKMVYIAKLKEEAHKYLKDSENYEYHSYSLETSETENEYSEKVASFSNCPACNSKLIDKQEVCDECGLALV